LVQQQQQQQQQQQEEDETNKVHEYNKADGGDEDEEEYKQAIKTAHRILSLLLGLIVGCGFYTVRRMVQYRYQTRRLLMSRMYQERMTEEVDVNDSTNATNTTPLITTNITTNGRTNLNSYLKQEDSSIRASTKLCGCLPKDVPFRSNNNNNNDDDDNDDNSDSAGIDFCQFLWKAFSSLFCGACCGCWCQCVGLCAVAQEDREVQRMMPKKQFRVDYITFQPFEDYAAKLMALRVSKVNSMLQHMDALSQLSKYLVQILMLSLGGLTIFAVSGLDPNFQPIHLAVVVLTLFQAFTIIFVVHWLFHKFDLSLDAVIKYFASGFLLCTANAFVYEMLVSTALGIASWIVRASIAILREQTGSPDQHGDEAGSLANDDGTGDGDGGVQNLVPIWVLVIVAFLNAFAVAALVEEISKYFGYWMVEHPDLLLLEEDGSNQSATEEESALLSEDSSAPQHSTLKDERSLKSLGAGITVAMVTTAVGFACCENFMYIFLYTRPANPVTEASTLLARSIFPVHPLAAAIQSIGVCRRDVEKDRSMGLGRILFPALLLHGSFDFALMFLELLLRSSDHDNDDGKPVASPDDPDIVVSEALQQQLPGIICSICIVLIGIIYFVVQTIRQRRRLVAMDERRLNNNGYEQLS